MKNLLSLFFVIILQASAVSQGFNLDEWFIPEGVKVRKTVFEGKTAMDITNTKKEDGGIVYLKDFSLKDGVIECDIASNTVVGITFRVQNEFIAECIYFRPYNSSTKKYENTVQYVARGTKYDWSYLRENYPGKYESGADLRSYKWFHVRIEFKDKSVRVFVNKNEKPALIVKDLKLEENSGSVGFWTWKGYYANFKASKF